MLLTSAVKFFSASKLALALLAGAVGVAAAGGLAVASIHLASTTTQHATSAATPGAQAQANSHGADVTAAVAKCKAALSAGQHGIGKCVSAVANKHGKAVSAAASANGKKNAAADAGETDPVSTP